MDWKSIKFDWNRTRAFLVTAEEGSLSAAARALDLAQPTLGRQIASLEEELGVKLFERMTGGMELTPIGLMLLESAQNMADAASQISLVANGQSNEVSGPVCITATDTVSTRILPPILRKLHIEEPGIQVEIVSTNSNADLKRREADIAVRNVRPSQPDLIAKRLKDIKLSLYATPEYLQSIGSPSTVDGFTHADFIGFNDNEYYSNVLASVGLKLTSENFPFTSDNHLVQWELVKQGMGIGAMADIVGDTEQSLRKVLPELDPIFTSVWLVSHSELRTNRRIRFVFDFLAQEMSR